MGAFTVIGVFVLAVVLIYRLKIAPTVSSPLWKVPNAHFSTPFVGTWIWWVRRQQKETRTLRILHDRLGHVVRLGPAELSICSPAGLKAIYVGGFEKDPWYLQIINYGAPNLVGMLGNKPHSEQKRILTHVYSKSYVQSSADLQVVTRTVLFDRFLPILSEAAAKTRPLNILELGRAAFMDMMSGYLFGIRNATNFMGDMDFCRSWYTHVGSFLYDPPHKRLFGDIEKWAFDLCQKTERFQTAPPKPVHDATEVELNTRPVVYEQLSQRLSRPEDSSDSKSNPSPKELAIASEMLDHLVAGSDAPAITLTYAMHELSRNPDIQAALRAELLSLSPPLLYPGSFSASERDVPSPRAIDQLSLLDAVLKETLRLYTPGPAPLARTSLPTTIEGYDIPGGIKVSANAYTLHRNPKPFPDPQLWSPQRWLTADKAHLQEMNRWWWAFGSGGRMCIGNHFALQEMKVVMTAIYSNFSTTIIDDEGIEQIDAFIAGPKGNKLVLDFQRL